MIELVSSTYNRNSRDQLQTVEVSIETELVEIIWIQVNFLNLISRSFIVALLVSGTRAMFELPCFVSIIGLQFFLAIYSNLINTYV